MSDELFVLSLYQFYTDVGTVLANSGVKMSGSASDDVIVTYMLDYKRILLFRNKQNNPPYISIPEVFDPDKTYDIVKRAGDVASVIVEAYGYLAKHVQKYSYVDTRADTLSETIVCSLLILLTLPDDVIEEFKDIVRPLVLESYFLGGQ